MIYPKNKPFYLYKNEIASTHKLYKKHLGALENIVKIVSNTKVL